MPTLCVVPNRTFHLSLFEVPANRYTAHLVEPLAKGVRLIRTTLGKLKKSPGSCASRNRNWYFQVDDLGEYKIVLESRWKYENGKEGNPRVITYRIYARQSPTQTEITFLRPTKLTTTRTYTQNGKTKKKRSVEIYQGLKLNGVQFERLPEDFGELIDELAVKGQYGLKVDFEMSRLLSAAGLMNKGQSESGDSGTEELRRNAKRIKKAFTQLVDHGQS